MEISSSVRDPITAAETDREKNFDSLKTSYEAHSGLLENIGRRQEEISKVSSAHSGDLSSLLEKMDLLHLKDARASIRLNEQQEIFTRPSNKGLSR